MLTVTTRELRSTETRHIVLKRVHLGQMHFLETIHRYNQSQKNTSCRVVVIQGNLARAEAQILPYAHRFANDGNMI